MSKHEDAEFLREAARLLDEAGELLEDSRRYLSEFGSVDPGLLHDRIKRWQNDMAIAGQVRVPFQ